MKPFNMRAQRYSEDSKHLKLPEMNSSFYVGKKLKIPSKKERA